MSKNGDFVKRGLNIYYYGNGKGKTTAVMGLATRAAGAGINVFILQFVKAKRPGPGKKLQSGEWPLSSEISYFEANTIKAGFNAGVGQQGKIITAQFGLGFVGILGDSKQRADHIKEAKKGLKLAKKIVDSGKYGLVILDELISALELKLVSQQDILDLIQNKPQRTHMAYTGHNAFKRIVQASDLVSEMKMIKHPYYKGILAQKGIDF